ncbi:MAG: (Fe-S)-binding protein [Cyanobacteriota bacterium]|nr:(Fe-S)-binding protein [Synechococcus sp. Tobar2m-G35]MEB3239483.1 (Fe-S)-binding protein [Cyanobacteriota bacterium]
MTATGPAPVNPADPCVHCGFCLPTCASWRVLGTEMDSPRGRIHTLKAIEAGELTLDATVASHFDSCLGCFACVTACPASVRYDQLIEAVRPQLNAPELRSPAQRALRRLLLALLPYPRRLRALLAPLAPYAGSALQGWLRRQGVAAWLGPELQAMEALLPALPEGAFGPDPSGVLPARGPRRARVGLVLGCVQRVFDPAVNGATLRVLQANGIEVVLPEGQGCCGAVTHHQGDLPGTAALAADLAARFRAAADRHGPLDAVLVAASGCGHTLKHYGTLLPVGDGGLPAPVLDVHEFLDQLGLADGFRAGLRPLPLPDGTPSSAERPLLIAYHDACHMIHGQGIQRQPRQLLQAIPHVQLREATEAGVCCGSAGIYNLVQPEEAAALGRLKVDDLAGTGAHLAASANIGCTLQLRRHLADAPRPIPVLHPLELLDRSAQTR